MMRLIRLSSFLFAAATVVVGSVAGQTPDLYDEEVLRHLELTFSDPGWFNTLARSYPGDTYFKADLEMDGKTFKDVGVRFRGNTSYRAAARKKPFKISMDAFVPGQKILGYRTLNLNNCAFDPSFVREVLTFHIFRKYCAAPRANFVKVTVNGENFGVYVNVQQINKDLGREWFKEEDGNRYRAEPKTGMPRNSSALIWHGWNPVDYHDSYELKSENAPNPWVDLVNLCDVMNNTTLVELERDLPAVLSMDSALWMLALNNALVNPDSYINYVCHNYYLYHDLHHSRFRLLAWDVDHSFSSKHLTNWKMDPYTQLTNAGRPLISRVFKIRRWQETYLAHIRTVVDDFISWEVLGPMIMKYQALIDAEVKADPINVHTYQDFKNIVTGNLSNFSGLKPFIETRRQFLLGLDKIAKPRPDISNVRRQPQTPTSESEVWITALVTAATPLEKVWLNHRLQGPFQQVEMLDDGAHNDGAPGDGVFGGKIPAQALGSEVEYFVEASLGIPAGGGWTVHPHATEYQPFRYTVMPPLSFKLSEFLAMNESGLRDEWGNRDDWIEVVNLSRKPATASGLYLTDEEEKPTKWRIPPGYVVLPGQTLIIWADDETSQGPLHASFKLSSKGEMIALYAADGKTLLDRVQFGPQVADVSTGRLLSDQQRWVTFPAPSPWLRNTPGTGGNLEYSAGDPTKNASRLTVHGLATPGVSIRFELEKAPPLSICILAVSWAPFAYEIPPAGMLLIHPVNMNLQVSLTDHEGKATFNHPISSPRPYGGMYFYAQCFTFNETVSDLSSAVQVRYQPEIRD